MRWLKKLASLRPNDFLPVASNEFDDFSQSLVTMPLALRQMIGKLQLISLELHPQMLSNVLSHLPNLRYLSVIEGSLVEVGLDDLAALSAGPKYRMDWISFEFVRSRRYNINGVEQEVWTSAAAAIATNTAILTMFSHIGRLNIYDCSSLSTPEVEEVISNARLPRETLRVDHLDLSAFINEPSMEPLIILLDQLLVPGTLRDLTIRQIWGPDELQAATLLLKHGNIRTWAVNYAPLLELPEVHDTAALARACVGPLQRVSLGVSKTDASLPYGIASEICTSLTTISLIPPIPTLTEIDLHFKLCGQVTQVKLMKALLGCKDHWKWIDKKLAGDFPNLTTFTINLVQVPEEDAPPQDPMPFGILGDRASVPLAEDGNILNLGYGRVYVTEVEVDNEVVEVIHPPKPCTVQTRFALPRGKPFFDAFREFFEKSMVNLKRLHKLQVVHNGESPVEDWCVVLNRMDDD